MKTFIFFVLTFFHVAMLKAQQKSVATEILSQSQIKTILNDSIRKQFKINFPIIRVYKYADTSGEFLCVLTESEDEVHGDDTVNYAIKAINLKVNNNKLSKVWEINDHIEKNDNNENSISFWTRYVEFKDFDNDGLIDPIIVYATRAMNDYDDGRIKFIIFYKGKKIAIRHQNGVLDNERETQVDDSYYSLPQNLKNRIKQKMQIMTKEGAAIFTAP